MCENVNNIVLLAYSDFRMTRMCPKKCTLFLRWGRTTGGFVMFLCQNKERGAEGLVIIYVERGKGKKKGGQGCFRLARGRGVIF